MCFYIYIPVSLNYKWSALIKFKNVLLDNFYPL